MLWILLFSMIVLLLAGELVVRLTGLTGSNIMRFFDKKNKIYKGKPKLKGKYKKKYISGTFQFNNEGWNSTHDYFKEKKSNTCRIACLGGSETEALQVDVDKAYPQILEDLLRVNGVMNEVYTFANFPITTIHGLHLARYVVEEFVPDILVVTLIGRDVLEIPGTENIHMKLLLDSGGNIKEVMPADCNVIAMPGNIYINLNIFRRSKLLIYLNLKLGVKLKLIKKVANVLPVIGRRTGASNKKDSFTFTHLTTSKDDENGELATRYVLEQYKKIIRATGSKILFAFGPLHDNSFNWRLTTDELLEIKKRRSEMKLLLEEYVLSYLDLSDEFSSNYRLNKKKFDFLIDRHYNELGHKVIGGAIAQFLLKNDYFK